MSNTTVDDVSYSGKSRNAKKNTQSLMSAQPVVMEGFTGLHQAAVAAGT